MNILFDWAVTVSGRGMPLRPAARWLIMEAMAEPMESISGEGIRVQPSMEYKVPVLTFALDSEVPASKPVDNLFEAVRLEYDKLSQETKNSSLVVELKPGTALKTTRMLVHLWDYVRSKRGRVYCIAGPEDQSTLAMLGFTNLDRVLMTRTKDDALGLAMPFGTLTR